MSSENLYFDGHQESEALNYIASNQLTSPVQPSKNNGGLRDNLSP